MGVGGGVSAIRKTVLESRIQGRNTDIEPLVTASNRKNGPILHSSCNIRARALMIDASPPKTIGGI